MNDVPVTKVTPLCMGITKIEDDSSSSTSTWTESDANLSDYERKLRIDKLIYEYNVALSQNNSQDEDAHDPEYS